MGIRGVPREGFVMDEVPYPVQFSVDYPDRPLNRLTTFFRIFMVIPIAIVLGFVSGGAWQWTYGNGSTMGTAAGTCGLLFLPPLVLLPFRRKNPPFCFHSNPIFH